MSLSSLCYSLKVLPRLQGISHFWLHRTFFSADGTCSLSHFPPSAQKDFPSLKLRLNFALHLGNSRWHKKKIKKKQKNKKKKNLTSRFVSWLLQSRGRLCDTFKSSGEKKEHFPIYGGKYEPSFFRICYKCFAPFKVETHSRDGFVIRCTVRGPQGSGGSGWYWGPTGEN